MTLSSSGLAAAVKTQLDAKYGVSAVGAASTARQNFCDAIGAAVIAYLVANTVVAVSVSTTGTAAAQTGTGTGSIT